MARPLLTAAILLVSLGPAQAVEPPQIIAKPGSFPALTEPPCSYASTQHRKNLIRPDDRVLAWLRASHNGGAVPIRLFLSATRVINDTYGLFFYDPDGDYTSAFKKDYGYEFYGWRRGVMVARSKDGTLWSALSGRAFEGPQKGKRLERIPALLTEWAHWLMLHPESTAYDLFDGKRYAAASLPTTLSSEARQSMGRVDPRLEPLAPVLGVEVEGAPRAFPLDPDSERACYADTVGGVPVAVFWYAATRSAVAWRPVVDGRQLTFYADAISPETAPFKDRETGTRWTLAGRAVDGPLRGRELEWIPGVQCRWYAWAAEYPDTVVHRASK